MSTSTSDSCSETSVDPLGPLVEKSGADLELPCNEMDESNQFEDNEDGFENIDSIEDFPIGMSKEAKHLMTDSGISEKDLKDFGDQTTDAVSNRRSVDFDATVVIHSDQDIGAKSGSAGIPVTDENLSRDLANGHNKQERPLSLISTTSADTGYAPDTDSEAGTLTTNSPTDWTEKHQLSGQTVAAHSDVKAKGLGLMKRQPSGLQGLKENEDDLDRTDCPESVNSEKAGEEEGEATDTSSSENEADERPEDDRIEADQPLIETSRTTRAGAAGESRESSQEDSITSQDAVQLNSEMTESAEPLAPHDEEKEESDSTVKEVTPTKSEDGALADFDAGAVSAQVGDENLERKENQRKDSKESLDTSAHKKGKAVPRKIVIEHKKVNVKAATSKLADYIKAPLPVKPKEENKMDAKPKRNSAANTSKSLKQQDASPDNSVASVPDKSKGDSLLTDEKKQASVKEEKPKVKRATPKSKWGNIMSQIEANKDTKGQTQDGSEELDCGVPQHSSSRPAGQEGQGGHAPAQAQT
ncbi:hypothetical protein C0Q70_05700 [Pomacea canaliculata]|uniref:Uncharacterized protein n=1 Tax=Pomacea canaliculata TaxID=400727 RepID=A0A2T7PM13_POMCA|nr:hypothetical protein C0Q70_05700 [Pomacea canaliculata]